MPSHKSKGIFKGTVPVRGILTPFSTEMTARAGFEPSHQWAPEANFRYGDGNTHSTISDTDIKAVLNEG